MAEELSRFKQEISLVELACRDHGYQLDQRESSRNSKVLRKDDEKLVVTRDRDGHDIYFSVGGAGDGGTVIDFVQQRQGGNLGEVRRALRQCLAIASLAPPAIGGSKVETRPEPTSREYGELLARWGAARPYEGGYLGEQGCSDETVLAFGVRQDDQGNACFPHLNREREICGWEVENEDFTDFSLGGQRGLMMVRMGREPVAEIVVTERAIDALNWAQFRHQPGMVYVSLGGALEEEQRRQLGEVFGRNLEARVILAIDRDGLAEEVQRIAVAAGLEDGQIDRQRRSDWKAVQSDVTFPVSELQREPERRHYGPSL